MIDAGNGRGPHNRTAWSTLTTTEFLAFAERVPDKSTMLTEAIERLHEAHEREQARLYRQRDE